MRIFIQLIVASLLSIGISNISEYRPNDSTLNVLYTVSGILFSVGLGLIITFVPNGVKNPAYIVEIRKTLNGVRNRFFIEFSMATLLYVFFSTSTNIPIISIKIYENIILKVDIMLFASIIIFFSLPYFMINFLAIQKLNNDIFDRVTAESK